MYKYWEEDSLLRRKWILSPLVVDFNVAFFGTKSCADNNLLHNTVRFNQISNSKIHESLKSTHNNTLFDNFSSSKYNLLLWQNSPKKKKNILYVVQSIRKSPKIYILINLKIYIHFSDINTNHLRDVWTTNKIGSFYGNLLNSANQLFGQNCIVFKFL